MEGNGTLGTNSKFIYFLKKNILYIQVILFKVSLWDLATNDEESQKFC